jgi:SAM-dependent methyltransferase
MITGLPNNALDILACPNCGAFPLKEDQGEFLQCNACNSIYGSKRGTLDLRPPGYAETAAYQGDTAEAAELRNSWNSTHAGEYPGVQAAIEQANEWSFSGCRILDAGSGTGHITRWISEQVGGEPEIWAIDVSEAMCVHARRNISASKNVTITRAASDSMPFRRETFDIILERLAPINLAVAHALLRSEGWFIESGFGDSHWLEVDEVFGDRCIKFPKDELEPKERLSSFGFTETEFQTWRYTKCFALDEIISIIKFAPILHSFDQNEDAALLGKLSSKYGSSRGIDLTVEETLLWGRKSSKVIEDQSLVC